MSPTEAGKVFSRRVLFIEFIITVYFCPEILIIFQGFLSVIMSKITNFFTPGTSSDAGKRSKVSSNSDNDNKDEDDEPPAKRKST